MSTKSLTLADLSDPSALPPTLSFEQTYEILGFKRTSAYAAVHSDRFPVPIIGSPGKWRCPTLAVLKVLGVE